MKKLLNQLLGFAAIAILATQVISCKDDEDSGKVIASFNYEADEADYKTIHFTNFSKNFSSVTWNFGDATATSSEEDPSHTYAEDGTYTVVLTASGSGGTATFEQEIVIENPNAILDALAGSTSKTWKLLRDASTGRYPLLVGPLKTDGATIDGQWWGMGRDNDEIAIRSCMLNHEYTFTRAGLTFERNLHGAMWAEGHGTKGQFPVENVCFDTTDPNNMKDKDDGSSLAVWGDFEGTFSITPGTPNKLKIDGLGAYMGIEKVGTDLEVEAPQSSVTYNIEKLYDGTVDTLMVRVNYKFNSGDALPGGYWMFTFVHYDNPGDEPPIPGNKPTVAFSGVMAGNQLTTTNETEGAVSYSWDFGDNTTSTAAAPVHTYTSDGIYNVTLTATNASGSNTVRKLFVANATTPALTDALLQGAAWKVRADELSLFVGPAMGSYEWYVVPKADMLGSWACLANDEFKFSAGGVYSYDTKGDVRDDGYFAGIDPNGCFTDAQLATSTNDGKKYRTFANHTYTFTAASGANRAKIVVTDGAADAKAFVGFYKAFWGGENKAPGDPTTAGNGTTSIQYEVMAYAKSATKEYLYMTVDISGGKDGSASWSFILIR
ncbi:MAG TPA: PKD domain-containing protein [Cyclobacteriaceae bacterium]|nr:PKD domain-containing protein [Cyclobacteriaceae bacterium]HMV10815.1 PKD domain-containing protein [Cyclobacteriaceae bacterium]HMV88774.1 PKD domain-containing protein [Cyclobacteriaceae bacterium]HMX02332.1 PKD domain-containing protein [Cyclobacteriaceae bacterium]HMX51703.1 PKD domain-containing protein [Cyclobacteriaceae bacterium]